MEGQRLQVFELGQQVVLGVPDKEGCVWTIEEMHTYNPLTEETGKWRAYQLVEGASILWLIEAPDERGLGLYTDPLPQQVILASVDPETIEHAGQIFARVSSCTVSVEIWLGRTMFLTEVVTALFKSGDQIIIADTATLMGRTTREYPWVGGPIDPGLVQLA